MQKLIQPPLSNIQSELLKLFTVDLPERDLVELKKMIARYLLERARDQADEVWKKSGYSDERLLEILSKE